MLVQFKVQGSRFKVRKKCLTMLVLGILFTSCHLPVNAQDIDRARNVVSTLAAPSYHGRGYVNDGDSLAAEYLASEFKTIGLKSLGNDFFQPFGMSVNTFPGKMKLKVGGRKLDAGKDFIVNPACPTVRGKFQVEKLDSTHYIFRPIKRISNNIVHVTLAKKLTYSVSQKVGAANLVLQSKTASFLRKKAIMQIENKFIPSHTARNVLGYLEGTSKKDSFLLVTAHYDHLGRMGKGIYFPGANDNASGVAMLLELARFYSLPENRLPYSILFIGFAAEEAGLLGSKFYTENPVVPLAKIRFMLNLDLMGSGKEGVTVVNGSIFTKEFGVLDSLNKANHWLPLVKPRGKAANSDHYHFSEKGVPAFFVYTMGEITAYHDIDDKPEVVTFSKFKECFGLITGFLKRL